MRAQCWSETQGQEHTCRMYAPKTGQRQITVSWISKQTKSRHQGAKVREMQLLMPLAAYCPLERPLVAAAMQVPQAG